MITEDFAYERLHEQHEYLQQLRKRKFPDFKRKWDICRSAIFIYWKWKDEVKRIQNLKRLMEKITITVSVKEPLRPEQLDYLKTQVNILFTQEFSQFTDEISVEQMTAGKKKVTGTSHMEMRVKSEKLGPTIEENFID